MQIGMIGLGRRGADMVRRLAKAGHDCVVYDAQAAILAAMKKVLKNRLTAVFSRQGHYALDPQSLSTYPPVDLAVDRIGDLLHWNCSTLPEPSALVALETETK